METLNQLFVLIMLTESNLDMSNIMLLFRDEKIPLRITEILRIRYIWKYALIWM